MRLQRLSLIAAATTATVLAACDRSAKTAPPVQAVNITVTVPPVANDHKPAPPEEKPQFLQTMQQAVVTEEPPAKRYAPEGVFYLRQPVRVETDSGIVGYKRGTQLIKTKGGTLKTSSGDVVITDDANLTNDLDEIREIVQGESASQAALKNWQEAQAQMDAARQAEMNTPPLPPGAQVRVTTTRSANLGIQQTRTVTITQTATPAPQLSPDRALPSNPLERGAYNPTRIDGGYVWRKNVRGQWVIDHAIR